MCVSSQCPKKPVWISLIRSGPTAGDSIDIGRTRTSTANIRTMASCHSVTCRCDTTSVRAGGSVLVIFGLRALGRVMRHRACHHLPNLFIRIGGDDASLGMAVLKHPEYLVGKCLSDRFNAGKIQDHFLKPVESCQQPFGLRTRY